MKHNLPENIRNFRKQKSLTQEQLAEAVGVTVGTVSKWENGNCLPDISMITELADFYEVSIDVLVGYDTPSKSVSNAIKKIEDYYKKHQLDEAILECNKALVKYPNNFDLLEKAARVYYIAGIETKDEIARSKAKILYENALTNKPDNVKTTKEIAIRHGLAMLEKDSDKKVDLLRDINIIPGTHYSYHIRLPIGDCGNHINVTNVQITKIKSKHGSTYRFNIPIININII